MSATGTSGIGGTADMEAPITVLIGALGGEGGGVLTDWLVSAAMATDFPVQSTSIPGVAQRTGATTYYLEIFPRPRAELDGREPVLSLFPSPGRIDLAVSSELLEAGRMVENGFVSPERTTMVASTHRVYATSEKIALGDGRFDTAHVPGVIRQMAHRAYLFDLPAKARETGSVLNALLLGVILGSGVLPLPVEAFQEAIREKGIAVEANLQGLETGLALARDGGDGGGPEQPLADEAPPAEIPPALAGRLEAEFPAAVHEVLRAGVARLVDFQNTRYAERYLERLRPILALESGTGGQGDGAQGGGPGGGPGGGAGSGSGGAYALTRETGRFLAGWMSYEDAIRVADLKTRPARFTRIRAEAGANPGEPLRIIEYLDPGLDEICAILPSFLARPLLWLAARRPGLARFRRPMQVRTDSVTGFLKLWLMARLRRLRPLTHRWGEEQALIERWLAGIRQAAAHDPALALEAAQCARLIKGYGDTHHRGRRNFDRIYSKLIEGGGNGTGPVTPGQVRQAREAALADEEGSSLDGVLSRREEGGYSLPG